MVLQAYRFALDSTVAQEALLRSHCGGQRYAYNWALARLKANLGQRAAEASYGVAEGDLTPWLSWSAYPLRKDWNQVKETAAPWWGENSKEAYSSGLANLATALGNWNASRTGKRTGPKVRFPRFKGKRAGLSCRFTTGAFGLAEDDRRHVKLPRIGSVRTQESTRKLARHIERDKSLAVLSTGEIIANPRHLDVALQDLRRLQRQAARRVGPDRRTRQTPSARWRKTQARINRLHAAVANARRDGLHKLSTRLVRTHGVIVLEDLHVAGMLRSRRLARRIAGVGMGELRRLITYKTGWAGGRVHLADRWFPSSKTCSDCGAVKAKLRLSERTFRCDQCAFTLDRDLNAARNLAQLVDEVTGGMSSPSCGATLNEPDGNPRKTRTTRAPGTATGRPGNQAGPTPNRKVTAHDTFAHVS